MLSLVIFIAALVIFIGFFSQSIQTALSYQQHTAMSTKTSDLLDTILLNPGLPQNWSSLDTAPAALGLQDVEFSQYKLSSFSTMRLTSTTLPSVYYPRAGLNYSNITAGYGAYLLTSPAQTVNYSAASKLLGINGTYGFQLSLTPTIEVAVTKTSTGSPLQFSVYASGTGLSLANAEATYNLIVVNQDSNPYPSYTIISGNAATDGAGNLQTISFPGVNGETRSYALVVYVHLYGLKGVGYYVHVDSSAAKTVVPLIDSFENQTMRLAHSDSVGPPPQNPIYTQLSYNATFAIVTEEYTLRQVILNNAEGTIDYGPGSTQDYTKVAVPNNAGILIIAYKTNVGQYGIVLAPWGLGSLGFPISFGGNAVGQDWVTTDLRQITIGGIAYQAKLDLWTFGGHAGIS
jgi:hypothetical protein